MALPAAVQKIKEATDKAIEEWRQEGVSGLPEPAEPEPEGELETETPVVQEPEPKVVDEVIPVKPDEPSEVDRLKDELQKAVHRYDVLAGKYNAEIGALHKQVVDLSDDVVTLTSKLGQRGTAPVPDATEEEDSELIGPDALAAIKRQIQKAVEPLAAKVGETAKRSFSAEVNDAIPDWGQIQAHDQFQPYMHAINPATGFAWGEHLNDAIARQDVQRVAAIYGEFKRVVGEPKAEAKAEPIIKSLEKRLAPSGATAASAPPLTQAKVFTESEVATIYTAAAKARSRPLTPKEKAEWDAKEKAIERASIEGRIVRG